MFRTLHKIAVVAVIGFWTCLAMALGLIVYQQRAVFYPAVDGFEALKAWISDEQRVAGEFSGNVIKVDVDYAFLMKDAQGVRYQFRLAGLEIPNPAVALTKPELEWKRSVRTNLSNLILSNEVQVLATYINEHRSGVGVVFLGETNMNALLVEQGLAKVKPEYLKGLPLRPYYTFLRAQRRAQAKQVGIWNKEAPAKQTAASFSLPP